MERKFILLFGILLFGMGFVSSTMTSSSNYNIDAAVVSSGGDTSNSSNFVSKTALGVISGFLSSLNFENFLGIFYGIDTTASLIDIIYPISEQLYYQHVGDINYTVDPTALFCWYSKDNGVSNSSVVVAGTNWTNVYYNSIIGENNWVIYCNDSAGNIGKSEVSFNVDNEIPNVYFNGATPEDGSVLQNSYFTINASSNDESGEHSTFLDFNNSLVGWWKLEQSEDDITFIDSSQYGNDGICTGTSCPNVTGGERGLAYKFDGNDDYLRTGIINAFTSERTISMWAYLESYDTENLRWLIEGNAGSGGYYGSIGIVYTDTLRFYCGNTSESYINVDYDGFPLNTWKHIVVVWKNNAYAKMYVDGVLIGTTDASSTIFSSADIEYVIGSYRLKDGRWWDGSIDDVMIFNRALSESEIKSIYNAQENQYGNDFSNIGNGDYNYTIYSQDLAGNVNSTSRNLTINMIPSDLNVSTLNNKELNSELGALNLTWADSSNGEDGFSIERSDDNVTFSEINSTIGDVTNYNDDNLLDNSIFFYRLRSFVGDAYSSYSNIAYNITSDRTAPLNPLLSLISNSSANGINVNFDNRDDGLVLYLPFEEGIGTTANDWSGENNNGVINGASWASGKDGNGGALDFDGIDNYVEVSSSESLKINESITVSGWIKPDLKGTREFMATKWTGFTVEIGADNKLRAGAYFDGFQIMIADPDPLINNTWTYVSFTYDINTRKLSLYKNGLIVSSRILSGYSSYNMVTSDNNLGIGKYSNYYWNGNLDEIRIYNRSLSQREIINDMQSGLIKNKLYMSEEYDGIYLDLNTPIVNGDAELGDTTNFGFDGVTNDAYEGDYAFYESASKGLISNDFIPIDSNSEYTLSGMFKSNGSAGLSRLYFGFAPYDENKNQISNQNVNVVVNTETELYEDIKSTDTTVKVKDCSNWYTLWNAYMAFNIDDSGNYADLPNHDLSNRNITRIQNMGDYCEIEFGTTVGKTYPAGTKVRMHTSGSGYMYSAASYATIPTTWTEYKSNLMTGNNLYGASDTSSFWPGTKYIKILFLANYGQYDQNYQLLIDNIKLTVNKGNVSTSNFLDFTGYDREHPSGIDNLNSGNVSEDGFYVLNNATFNWDAASDSGSDYFYYSTTEDEQGNYNNSIKIFNSTNITTGVAGYSVLCDSWKNSIPNNIIDTSNTDYTCNLTEGANYFFVKAIDGAGNGGDISRFGPFYVDSGAPEIEFISPTPDNETSTTNTSMNAKISVNDYSLANLNFSWNNINLTALDDSLVLAMNFQNLSSLNENNTFVKDITNNGNDGTISEAIYTDEGKYGKGLDFDGIDDYVEIEPINISNEFSVSLWVNGAGNTNVYAPLVEQGGDIRFRIIKRENRFCIGNDSETNNFYCTISSFSQTNYWYNIIAFNNRTNHIFVNGIEYPLTNWASDYGSWNTNQLHIGYRPYTTSVSSFNGIIDEVKIYNRSLDEDEINFLYNSNLQKISESGWELSVNMTNLSRGDYLYYSSACDKADNCNLTETRLWSRINTAPVIDFVQLNTTDNNHRTYENLSVSIGSHDEDNDSVYNITDWRVNNDSLAVLNMPFNSNNSTYAKDYSSYENNGEVIGPTWTSNGKVGGAYEFDGVNDYIRIPYNTNLDFDNDSVFYGGAWINIKSYHQDANIGEVIFKKYSGLKGFIFSIYQNGNILIRGHDGSSTLFNYIVDDINLSLNTWYYVSFSFNESIINIYLNGNEIHSYSLPDGYLPVNDYLFIGSWGYDSYNVFNGSIDEVQVFDRALSSEQIKNIYDAGLANHSVLNISSEETNDGEEWSVVVTPNDLIEDGNSVDSNHIILQNHLPTVTLNYPLNDSDIINRTSEFNWTGYDQDGDELTYELEIEEHKSSGTSICNDDISRNNLNDENWVPTQDLKCLGDFGYYYTWRVRAYDGESYGEWTDYNTFRINAYVVASLANNEVNFGDLGMEDSDNTSDGNPQPFIIRNDGNVKINISANATPIWDTQEEASEYYITKIDNRTGEEGSFNWLTSVIDWINMSITGRVTMIDSLDYHDNNDSAEIDIGLTVPPNEGPGLKDSTVVFEAKLAEEDQ